MHLRRLIIVFYLLLFLSLAAGSGVFFWQTRQEYNRLLAQEVDSRRRLAEVQQKLNDQEKILERLRTNPDYVEKVIRQRLGYAKPDELIYRFEP